VNEKKYAPVILFVYRRPEHTIKTLEALNNNYLANESELYIFSDGYKNDTDRQEVEQVRNIINKYKDESNFKSVKIFQSEENRGLAESVIGGVTKVIDEHSRVIVLEDDLVTSPDFIKYMNEALDYYVNDNRVWSIAGYTPNIKGLDKYEKDVYVSLRAASWGWATWKNRWELVDWEVSDYQAFVSDKKARRSFGRRGKNMPGMLDAQMRGELDSWAIRFCYAQFRKGTVTIMPTISRVNNIGFDGTGTHCGVQEKWEVAIKQTVDEIKFIPIEYNKKLIKAYYVFYAGTKWERLINWGKKWGGSLKRLFSYIGLYKGTKQL